MATAQFDDAGERREASLLGMWVFLATEVLFFGPLFFGYLHARAVDYPGFVSGSHHMHIWLGTLNTAVLLTSSLTMALAVRAAQTGSTDHLRTLLSVTASLGIAFLCIKGFEWASEVRDVARSEGGERVFYFLYYTMTGLHALHLTIGVGLVSWLWATARRYGRAYFMPAEIVGLYWHFVDIIWVFLYPMFYLLERYSA